MARAFLSVLVLLSLSGPAFASRLDLTTDVTVDYLSYSNLALTSPASGGQTFYDHDARLGLMLKDIDLDEVSSGMDVAISFTSIGIGGSTATVPVPFNVAAERLPTVGLAPFLSSAYVRVHDLLGQQWTVTAGRQPVQIGSGLLLSDDGVGMTGLMAERPWRWDSKVSVFVFQPRTLMNDSNLNVYGASFELPGPDGVWQVHHVWEDDHASPTVLVGQNGQLTPEPMAVAERHFTSLRYLMKKGKLQFDGEFAVEQGNASGGGQTGGPSSVSFKGSAYVMQGKWDQTIGKFGVWQGRMVFARGTGGDPNNSSADGAFFPSFGHRFDGLERAGYGDYLGATPYDVLPVSTATPNGMPPGISGVQVVGLGATAPPWHKLLFDVDFDAFTANQSGGIGALMGSEWDLAVRYVVGDKLVLRAAYAAFSAGPALLQNGLTSASSKRFSVLASGRF